MATRKRKVVIYPSRQQIEIAPDVKIAPLPVDEIPGAAIARLQAVGDGTYRPVLRIYEPQMRLMEAARLLHIPYRTLIRLCRGGFVKSTQISPGNHQIDLVSWFEHVERVRQDPDFWQTEKNRRAYRDAL